MAAIAWTDVTGLPGAISSGLANVPVAGQTLILNVVNTSTFFDLSDFDGEDGAITKLARAAYAAHLAALGILGLGGSVIAEADGQLSRAYALPSNAWGTLGLTSFGQLFRSLIGSGAYGADVL